MMGRHEGQKELFSYQVDLDRRVRAAVDFGFVRQEVAPCYGYNGNESVDPEVILKLSTLDWRRQRLVNQSRVKT